MARRPLIGVDMGATKIQAVVLDGDEVAFEARGKTPVHGGPLAVVDAIAVLVKGLDARLEGSRRARAIGVGVPGTVDADQATVRSAPNLPGWVEPFDMAAALSDALDGRPVFVDNDVNVGIHAEHDRGAAKDERDVLGVFVGTGVGGALVLDDQLRRGPDGFAGEIGHTIVRPDGRVCRCGGRGHLEAYAGRAAMERRARTLESRGRDTMLVDLAPARRMTSTVFVKALAARDPVAVELIDEAVGALGTAIATAVTLVDTSLVVLGGGLADRAGPSVAARVEEAVRSRAYASRPIRVVPAALRDRGGALGAALVARDHA